MVGQLWGAVAVPDGSGIAKNPRCALKISPGRSLHCAPRLDGYSHLEGSNEANEYQHSPPHRGSEVDKIPGVAQTFRKMTLFEPRFRFFIRVQCFRTKF